MEKMNNRNKKTNGTFGTSDRFPKTKITPGPADHNVRVEGIIGNHSHELGPPVSVVSESTTQGSVSRAIPSSASLATRPHSPSSTRAVASTSTTSTAKDLSAPPSPPQVTEPPTIGAPTPTDKENTLKSKVHVLSNKKRKGEIESASKTSPIPVKKSKNKEWQSGG